MNKRSTCVKEEGSWTSLGETSNDILPVVAMDTSTLPLDIFMHVSVQSSSVRFEGGQYVRLFIESSSL